MKRKNSYPNALTVTFASLLVFFGSSLWATRAWIAQHFGTVTVDQMLLNIRGAGGEGAGGYQLIVSAIVCGLFIPALFAGFTGVALSDFRRLSGKLRVGHAYVVAIRALIWISIAAFVAITSISMSLQIGLPAYLRSLNSKYDLAEYYVHPSVSQFPSTGGRNLVVIYMESVEEKLSDDSVFEEDMLAPLERATLGWDSFQLSQPANGGWTLGGIVDTQCGIPLRMADAGVTGDALNYAGERGCQMVCVRGGILG